MTFSEAKFTIRAVNKTQKAFTQNWDEDFNSSLYHTSADIMEMLNFNIDIRIFFFRISELVDSGMDEQDMQIWACHCSRQIFADLDNNWYCVAFADVQLCYQILLKAVDLTFKLYQVLNLRYNFEAHNF